MDDDFLRLKTTFDATTSIVRVLKRDPPLKVAVLVSRKVNVSCDYLFQALPSVLHVCSYCISLFLDM